MFTLSLLLYIAMRLRRGSMLLRSGSKFNAPAARFKFRSGSSGSMLLRSGSRGSKAATQRSKFKVQCCFAAFKIQREAQGPYTLRSSFTRSSAALHAEGFTRAVGALPAPQVLYTRFSALNAQGFKEAVASSAFWLRFLAILALPRCL
jgi:hypothetical protein